MKIGLNTDSLGALSLDAMLDVAAELGSTPSSSPPARGRPRPHVDLATLLGQRGGAPRAARAACAIATCRSARSRATATSSTPSSGPTHDAWCARRSRSPRCSASSRVMLMSGLPGRARRPVRELDHGRVAARGAERARHQWEEAVIPYWQDLVAARRGARRRAPAHRDARPAGRLQRPDLLRLREAVGPVVGANYDPSHLMWMGADPIAAIDALGDAIYHVHAKDTRIEPSVASRSRLETSPTTPPSGRGTTSRSATARRDAFWGGSAPRSPRAGYDDVLSIEHEDQTMDAGRGGDQVGRTAQAGDRQAARVTSYPSEREISAAASHRSSIARSRCSYRCSRSPPTDSDARTRAGVVEDRRAERGDAGRDVLVGDGVAALARGTQLLDQRRARGRRAIGQRLGRRVARGTRPRTPRARRPAVRVTRRRRAAAASRRG